MSETTNLKLKKHDNVTTNTNQFDVENYMNGNWDKLDEFAGQVNGKTAELQEATIALQAELKATRKDYEAGTLEGQAEGESLYLQDSSNARFRSFGIGGNSKQATRTGKNKLDLSKIQQETKNGVTCTYNKDDDSVTFNGTCTEDNTSFIIRNQNIEAVINKTTLSAYYVKGSFSASHEERTQLRAFTNGYSRSITISLSIINSNNKVASSTYARPDDTLSLFSFKFDAGDVLENFTVKAMLTDEVDTEYEEYGTMPSMQFSSEVKAVGQDINIFDSSIFEDIEQNGVKIKRNVDGTLTLNGTYAGTSAWNYRFNLLEPISVDKEELYLSMQKIEGNCTGQIRFTAWEQNSDNRWLSFETSQYSNLLAEKNIY